MSIIQDTHVGAGSHLISEGNGHYSREEITLASGAGVLKPGAVLGRITAAGATLGMYAPYNNAATNGAGVVTAVLFAQVDTGAVVVAAGVPAVAHVRQAEVWKQRLQFSAGTIAADKTAAYADLVTVGILPREDRLS
jgi:hypothetical protein